MQSLITFMAAFGYLLLVVLGVAIALYVVSSIAHYRIYKALGYSHPIAAWVPIWSQFALADCAFTGEDMVNIFGLEVPSLVFKLYWLISFVLGRIPKIGSILGTVVNIFVVSLCYSRIYAVIDDKEVKDCIVLGVVSAIIPIVPIIKFFGYKPEY